MAKLLQVEFLLAIVLCAPLFSSEPAAFARTTDQATELCRKVTPAIVAVDTGYRGSDIDSCTGVLISRDGLILTSSISAKYSNVRFSNGTTMNAELLGRDSATGLSLLRIGSQNSNTFVHLEVADSAKAAVGDPVYSAANPYEAVGDGQVAFSRGTITGRYTESKPGSECGALLETDAAVNPGSEGGALLNDAGQLIGILSPAVKQTRYLGTAIPISSALQAFSKQIPDFARSTLQVSPTASRIRASCQTAQKALVKLRVMSRSNSRSVFVSGITVDAGGYVLTCASNLDVDFESVSAELPDGRVYSAHLIGKKATLDLALLKLDLPADESASFIAVSENADLEIGEPIVVLGAGESSASPTLNTGIISAMGRFDGTAVQTDAKINRDNAGGPVLDAHGKLIGIATRVKAPTQWNQQSSGVGFFTRSENLISCLCQWKPGSNATTTSATASTQFSDGQSADVAFKSQSGHGTKTTSTDITPATTPATFESPASNTRDNTLQHTICSMLEAFVFVGDGSGVVISSDGYILTNQHVTEERHSVSVQIGGTHAAYTADVVAIDANADLLLLKVRGSQHFAYLEFENMLNTRVGQSVIAAGDPFKLAGETGTPAFSTGIVSALHRHQGRYADSIQTDCAINPGNSGGPLVTMDGKLVGITGQIIPRFNTTTNSGVAFAIPSDQLQRFVSASKQNRK